MGVMVAGTVPPPLLQPLPRTHLPEGMAYSLGMEHLQLPPLHRAILLPPQVSQLPLTTAELLRPPQVPPHKVHTTLLGLPQPLLMEVLPNNHTEEVRATKPPLPQDLPRVKEDTMPHPPQVEAMVAVHPLPRTVEVETMEPHHRVVEGMGVLLPSKIVEAMIVSGVSKPRSPGRILIYALSGKDFRLT